MTDLKDDNCQSCPMLVYFKLLLYTLIVISLGEKTISLLKAIVDLFK